VIPGIYPGIFCQYWFPHLDFGLQDFSTTTDINPAFFSIWF
jgi:hypothetical protein